MQGFEFNTVRQIINGPGSALQLANQCRSLGINRPLMVTDPGLMSIGLVSPVLDALAAKIAAEGASPPGTHPYAAAAARVSM